MASLYKMFTEESDHSPICSFWGPPRMSAVEFLMQGTLTPQDPGRTLVTCHLPHPQCLSRSFQCEAQGNADGQIARTHLRAMQTD